MYGKFVPVKDEDGLWRVGKEQNVVQIDADIHLDSDPICHSAGCTQYKHPESTNPAHNYPINYPVPNFGMDRDVSDSISNTKVSEGIVGHDWTWKEKKKPDPVLFPGSERGLDSDMITSIDNMQNVEAKQGKWDLLQLNEEGPHSLS